VRLHDTDADGREVASATFTVKGELGADEPAATNDTPAGRALDRRVELVRR
jgi:outer membrane protein OmpA-like peptidoglycan-associated protein